MPVDATPVATDRSSPEVMASVEVAGSDTRFVIADISRDGAWVSVDESAAPTLEAWR